MNSFPALLISNIVLAAGLAVITYIITKKWRSPHLAHGLWLLVLVKLVTPPIVSMPLPQWIVPTPVTQVVEVTETNSTPILTETIQEPHVWPIPETLPTSVTSSEPLPLEHAEPRAIETEPADVRALPASLPFKLPTWPQTLFGVWCIGVIGLFLTAARRHWLLLRVIAKATPLQGPLREEAQAIARQLGLRHCPDLRVTTARVCPLVSAGWWKQTVLLPTQLLDQLTPEQHRSILTHELSHIRRRDHLVRRFELLVLAIHWWNPIAWLASRQLRQAEEQCCDAMVVSTLPDQRRCYGEALLQTIEFLTEGPTLSTIGASGFGEFTFSRRIETIMKMEVSNGMSWISRVVVLVVAVSVLPFAGAAVSRDEGTQDKSAKTKQVAPDKEPASEQEPMIRGTIVDVSGRPVPGASITAYFYGTEHVTGRADSKGRFALKNGITRAGGATLWASGPNKALGFVEFKWSIDKGDPLPPQRITLEPPRKIDVSVVSRKGEPVPGAKIAINANYYTAAQATTNAEGRASLAVPKAARIQFVLADAGDKGIDYFAFRRTEAPVRDPYQLAQDHGDPIVFTLSPTRGVTIHVVDREGIPVPGVTVAPRYVNLPRKGAIAILGALWMKQSNHNGNVKYDNFPLKPGRNSIDISVRKEGYISTDRITVDARTSSLVVTSPLVVMATLVPLVPMNGRVIHPDGSPVGGIEVRVAGDGHAIDGYRNTTVTSTDGSFQLDVHPNKYYVFAAGNEKWASPVTKRVVLEKAADSVELKVQRAIRIHGQLTTGGNSEPVKNASVSLYQDDKGGGSYYRLPEGKRIPNPTDSRRGISPRFAINTRTDENGRFEFFAGPGDYYVTGSRAIAEYFSLDDQEEVEVNVKIRSVVVSKTKKVEGRVVLHSDPSKGASEVSVIGHPEKPREGMFRVTTDSAGNFETFRRESAMRVGAFSTDLQLGTIFRAKAGAEKMTLKLAPTVTLLGKVTHEETGKAVANREVGAYLRREHRGGGHAMDYLRIGKTDATGRFEIEGVVPDNLYHLYVVVEVDSKGERLGWDGIGEFTPTKAGGNDVGELHLRKLFQ